MIWLFSQGVNKKEREDMTIKILVVSIMVGLMAGCADVVDISKCVPDEPNGFLGGWWHGIICGFSFIGSLFSDDIAIYSVNNNGGWYDFGFVLGAGIFFGGGVSANSK